MSDQPPAYGPPPGSPPYGPPPFDIGRAFSWAWTKFKANSGALVLGTLVLLLAGILVYVIAAAVALAVVPDATFFLQSDPETGSLSGLGSYFATLGVLYLVIFVLAIPLSVLSAGFMRLSLTIADGQAVRVADMFRVPNAGHVMGASALVALASLVGLILCYLPGLAFALFASFTIYFVVDHDQRPVEAIRSSFGLVKTNFGNALVVVLLAGLVGGAGVIVCLVGVLVTVPIALLVHTYAFRSFTGGTIAG